ncbi:OLC1v1010697C1 [Oldenlandia corymbosa var. corymbosa]|uniref:OLC1v1010697C1 n=1 Tax=Oldenlandia corymbosa var. corymbosa TaxID=529605 RepID=A0AAV1DRZ1_OLDCO|nr:OLC1v1010697C1 [Oldenlandia corymbosa var. corymbosa]
MALLSVPFQGSWKRQWRKRKYQRLSPSRKTLQVVKLGGGKKEKRGWKIRSIPKLRFKFLSPLKLWRKIKTGYMDMMLRLAGKTGALNGTGTSVYGGRRIPQARKVSLAYKEQEFENRIVYEIYKSLVASMELNPR